MVREQKWVADVEAKLDGMEAKGRADAATVLFCRRLIRSLEADTMPPFSGFCGANGVIHLIWRLGPRFLKLEFSGVGGYEFVRLWDEGRVRCKVEAQPLDRFRGLADWVRTGNEPLL